MKAVRILIALVLLAVALIAAAMTLGASLPPWHVASRYAHYRAPVDSVWAVIADWERSPEWRRDVKRVERLPDRDGNPVWKQVGGFVDWPLAITESMPPLRMGAMIADSSRGVGGEWSFMLVPDAGGTRLTVVERASVHPPLLRFVAHYVFTPESRLNAYLRALGRHFGETVTPLDAGVTE